MKKLLLIFSAILLAGSMWAADEILFSLKDASSTTLTLKNQAQDLTSSQATFSGGTVTVGVTSTNNRNVISSNGFLYRSDVYYHVALTAALQANDVISINLKGNSSDRSLKLNSDNSVTNAVTITNPSSNGTVSYTVASNDNLVGKTDLYLIGATSNENYFYSLTITRPEPKKTIYLNLQNFTSWENNGGDNNSIAPKFVVWDNSGSKNYDMTAVEDCSGHIYSAEVPVSSTDFYFKRVHSTNDSKWNEAHVTFTGSNNMASISNWDTGSEGTYTPTYPVVFNTNGHGTAPESQCIVSGNKATAPTAPTAVGFSFEGWYTEAACTNAFDFANTNITEKTTLYAKWNEDLNTTWKLHIWVNATSGWREFNFVKKTGESAGNVAYYTMYFPDANQHDFEVMNGSTYYKNHGTMTSSNCTNWVFTTSETRGKINTLAGYHIFKIDFADANNPKVSVIYPVVSGMFENVFTGGNNNNGDVYTISGNYTSDKGTATATLVDGSSVTLNTALKIESETNITFNAPADCKLKIVFGSEDSKYTIKYDDVKKTGSNKVLEIDVTAGTHTLTKADAGYVFYINLYDFKTVVSSVGYSTYYTSKYAYTMPEGMTGYIFDASEMKLVEAYTENQVVPVGEALVLAGLENAYTINFTTSATEKNANNALLGTDEKTVLTADANAYFYGLSLDANSTASSVGFYWMAEDGAAFENGAHKAYLKLAKPAEGSQTQAPRRFLFETTDTATDVESVEAAEEVIKFFENGQLLIKKNGVVYNVMGQIVR